MAKPFQLPAWRKKQINRKYARKWLVVTTAVTAMENVMAKAVDAILSHYSITGQYAEPRLNEMDIVSERFYRSVVTQAFHSAEDEKEDSKGRKKLAKGPEGIPRRLRDLEKIFRDRRYRPKILKRSEKLTARLRKAYLAKLRKKFEKLIPELREGTISPVEAKKKMMEAWSASKSRVENIFRTETTNYFGKTQIAFFEGDPEIIGFLFDSIRDQARTEICKSRHGLIYRPGSKALYENTPGLHWQCRSHLIALANTPYNRKMLEDPARDPAKRSVAPLPTGWKK